MTTLPRSSPAAFVSLNPGLDDGLHADVLAMALALTYREFELSGQRSALKSQPNV